MNVTEPDFLAMESAISGGSLALFRGDKMIASRAGHKQISRAEDLLPNVISLLNEAEVSKATLARIAVSLGPGSYTGLRIGISTVMGLCKGLDIPYVGIPLFEALPNEGFSIAAVPIGKEDLCFGTTGSPSGIEVGRVEDLVSTLDRLGSRRLLCHSDVIARLDGSLQCEVVDLGTNLAKYVGLSAIDRPSSDELKPIYVQNPRFG